METRVALIGIMVENAESVEKLNDLLHQYRSYIIGRMACLTVKRAFLSSASSWTRLWTRSAAFLESLECWTESAQKQLFQEELIL